MQKSRQLILALSCGLMTAVAPNLNGQVTNTIADQAIAGFNSSFIQQTDGLTFYRESLSKTSKDYFWMQALDIQSAEDDYYRARTDAGKTLVSNLLNAFLAQNKSNNTTNVQSWEWNEYNDDLFWATIAFCRGYQYTGNTVFLDQAKYGFNLAYYHTNTGNWGWDSQFGGGIWWDKAKGAKETLSNGPAIVSACYLYQFTGDVTYLNKAKEIYTWLRATLRNSATGEVWSKINADGTINKTVDVFNCGGFGGAANFLYQITGDINYFNDAKKTFDYIKDTRFQNGVMYATSRGGTDLAEYIRWFGEFVRENNLWNTYYPWLKLNADAAWSKRRTDRNITWNDWRNVTPSDNTTSVIECNSAVVIQEVTPIIQSIPATIQAENFNYMSGIQTETTTDAGGGKNVGFIEAGDWMDYIINVPTTGVYTIYYRVAGTVAGAISLKQNGQTVATTSIPVTGGFQTWTTVRTTLSLTAGIQSIRLQSVSGNWNINWWSAVSGDDCPATAITPYQNINGTAWVQGSTSTVIVGQGLQFGPQPTTGGSWSWTGPNGFTAAVREIAFTNMQLNQAGTYTATYTNPCGTKSTQNFIVDICAPTTIIPNLNVNAAGWQQTATATMALGGNITFGPQPTTGGTWSWTGPNGFTSTAREIAISNIQGNQIGDYVATYTNACGAKSTQTFTVTSTWTALIEAESYVAMAGVQTETCSEGGLDVTSIGTGDYMNYNVTAPTTGSYKIYYRVASATAGGILQLEKTGGGATYGTVNIPNTGGLQTWQTVSHTVNLTAGVKLSIKANVGGFNLNWWGTNAPKLAPRITAVDNLDSNEISIYPNPASDFVKITGIQTNTSIVISNLVGQVLLKTTSANASGIAEINISNLTSGTYIVNVGNEKTLKFLKR